VPRRGCGIRWRVPTFSSPFLAKIPLIPAHISVFLCLIAMTENKVHAILASLVVFFILSWITVSLRCYVRVRVLQSFGCDDWTMIVTQVLYCTYLILQIIGLRYGSARHVKDVSPSHASVAFAVRLPSPQRTSIRPIVGRMTIH
jgi:hypothetical protein